MTRTVEPSPTPAMGDVAHRNDYCHGSQQQHAECSLQRRCRPADNGCEGVAAQHSISNGEKQDVDRSAAEKIVNGERRIAASRGCRDGSHLQQ